MAGDLKSVFRTQSLAERIYNAYLNVWKESKVVWNPGTHGRNITGNLIFSDLGGNPVWDIDNWPYYQKGMRALIDKNETWKNLIKYNAIGTEYYGSDIKPILVDAEKTNGKGLIEAFIRSTQKIRGKAGRIYALEDQVYKAAAYEKYIASGMGPARAAAEVNKWFPNYQYLAPATRIMRKSPLGAPFLSFTDQATRIALRGVQEHPVKVAKWAALPGAMTEFSTWFLAMSPEERDVVDTNRNYFEPILPHRDEQGRVVTWDLRWTMPLANDLVPDARRYGIDVPWAMSGPVADSAVQLISGRDVFTGKPITKEDASLGRKILDHALEAAKTTAPIPSIVQFGPKRIWKAALDEDKARETLERSIAGTLAGINVRAPYIVRQKLYTDIREDILSGDPDRVINSIEKMAIFNNIYRTESQPEISVRGLVQSIRNEIRKDLKDYIEEQIK